MSSLEPSLRILVVPAKPWPSDHAMLESVFARILPARGHRVEWVMWADHPADPVDRWHGSLVHLTPYRAGTAFNAMWRWWSLLGRVVGVARRGRFDVVQVRNSTAAGLVALALRASTGARFAYQISFPVPEWTIGSAMRGALRAPRLRRLAARVQRALRGWLVRRADLVLAISDRMKADLLEAGASPDRVVTLPLGTDPPSEPDDAAVASLRAELVLDAEPVIIYVGSVAPERELGFLVDVAALVERRHPDARWLLVGPSAAGEAERLRHEAARAGLAARFSVRAAVPRKDVAAFLRLSTLTVSPVPPIPLFLVSSPTKTVESLAAGRPVVATPIPDQVAVVESSGGGLIAPYEANAFADAISGLLDDPERRAAMGAAGREWVRDHRSFERLATTLEHAYRDAIGARR